jgi:hypothetical protein
MLEIQLNNDGFLYGQMPYQNQNIDRHHSKTWATLEHKYAFLKKALPAIQAFFEHMVGRSFKLDIFYNDAEQRADIKGYKYTPAGKITSFDCVFISFERGSPYVDYSYEKKD